MKRLLSIAGLIFLFVLAVISFLPGYGPAQRDYQDESAGAIGPLSYFKTPQSAIQTASELLREKDWQRLSQFYDLRDSSLDHRSLLDGSYFRINSPDRASVRPFAPEYEFLGIFETEFDDVYEVVVRLPSSGVATPDGQKFLYLKRYPEGYRILPDRPASGVADIQ